MNLLKTHFPLVWRRLKELEGNLDPNLVKTLDPVKGFPNLLLDIPAHHYIHDLDDPVLEANKLIDQHDNPEEYSDVLFYGIGLGYHLNIFINRYPGIVFSIYEPVPEVFFQFLSYVDLTDIPLSLIKYIFVEGKPDDIRVFSQEYVGQMRDSVLVIDFPSYKNIFSEQYDNFFIQFEAAINERRSSVNVITAFEKRWTLNSILNFDTVLSTPNIILEKKDCFKNQPALLIAAGPSLEDEIENIRYIKENGLAYIFSVGSAINTLIDYNIHPHAACSYDPSPKNQVVFQKLVEQNIVDVPLIFGSSIGFETLTRYPGPKFHMLTKPDQVSPFYLKAKSGIELDTINDAPSISVVALQLLKQLGFNPIILVGQNFAYKDNKQHAEGLNYSKAAIDQKLLDDALEIEDVRGETVFSNSSFNRMRLQMELYIRQNNQYKIINTTQGGAKIKGTIFKSLDEVVNDTLQDRVVDENWLNLEGFNYDLKHLIKQYLAMKKAFDKMDNLIEKINYFLSKINKQAANLGFRQMDHIFTALENAYTHLKQNEFFNTFIMPMNQIADQILQRAIININLEKDNQKKAIMTVNEFEEYIYSCENDIQMITPVFQGMNTAIEDFIREYLQNKASSIKVLLINCEGILTDGGSYYSEKGRAEIKLNSRDILSLIRLQQKGIKIVIVSNKYNKILKNVFRQAGIECLFINGKGKHQGIEEINSMLAVSYDQIACIIDDIKDLDLIRYSGISFCVNDAMDEVRNQVDYLCALNGGEGVLREVARILLSESFPLQGTIIRTI